MRLPTTFVLAALTALALPAAADAPVLGQGDPEPLLDAIGDIERPTEAKLTCDLAADLYKPCLCLIGVEFYDYGTLDLDPADGEMTVPGLGDRHTVGYMVVCFNL